MGSLLICLFRFISPKLRRRARREQSSAKLLRKITPPKIWFHCSSEGELEQIWPIVERFLKAGDTPQLIWFTSPSLLAKADSINEKGGPVRMAYLPLLSLFPGRSHPLRYGKPEVFFMVRYDFFSELMAVGSMRVQRFILLSGTLKGKMNSLLKNPFKRLLAKRRYSFFDEIYFSTKQDLDFFKENCKTREDQFLSSHDFRHGQILSRQKEQPNLIESRCLDEFQSLISNYELNDRLIIGSGWPLELEIFTPDFLADLKEKKQFVLIAPHMLKGEHWDKFYQWFIGLQEQGFEACLWDHVGIHGRGNIVLCQRPGLLCELYPYFGHSFVGGGHGRSIHSLLEPFWGGGHIFCGPKTQRSTEHDFVVESAPAHIHIVVELKDFYDNYKDKKSFPLDVGARQELGSKVLVLQNKAADSFCQGGSL